MSHKECANAFVTPTQKGFLPRRLVDVRQSDGPGGVVRLVLRQHVEKGRDGKAAYFALSHCWGGTVTAKLSEANREQRVFSVADLDQNFRDAVAITRDLGVSYLWIDSLCILQGSSEWEQQSGEMGLIYANARCVISATAAGDSRGGCYQRRDMAQLDCILATGGDNGSLVVRYHHTTTPTLQSVFEAKVEGGPITLRGWTFQERFLANRVLHFCRGSILFECHTLIASQYHGSEEYGEKTVVRRDEKSHSIRLEPQKPESKYEMVRVRRKRRKAAYKSQRRAETAESAESAWVASAYRGEMEDRQMFVESARLGIRGAFRFLLSFQGSGETEELEFHTRWYEIVEHYSARRFTNAEDRLIALTGVAYFVQKTNSNLTYAAGLWTGARCESLLLTFGLLWVASEDTGVRPASGIIPSWSWASIDTKISHKLKVPNVVGNGARYMYRPTCGTECGTWSPRRNSWEDVGPWQEFWPMISKSAVISVHTIRDIIHRGTLYLSCRLYQFEPRGFDFCYDTAERPPKGEIVCLPILRFTVSRRWRIPSSQLHGILLVPALTAATPSLNEMRDVKTDEVPDCYRRVGYFWVEEGVTMILLGLGETRNILLI